MQRRSFQRSNKHHFSATDPLLLHSSTAMDKKLKLGIPRIFRIPFLSCRHRDVPDLAQEPVFVSHHLPKSHARPRMSLMTFFMEEVVAHQNPIGAGEGRERITPNSPLSSIINPSETEKQSNQRRRMQVGNRRKKRRASAKSREAVLELANAITSNSSSGDSYHFFTSSDEEKHFGKDQEEEEEAFVFSSMSSDSSATMRRKSARPRRKGSSSRRDEANSQLVEVDQSVAVVKSSSDPYADFRISMAEMIIEKQIFGAVELEKLLDCFLALNAPYHRQVIVEAFEEICETLFCNWS